MATAFARTNGDIPNGTTPNGAAELYDVIKDPGESATLRATETPEHRCASRPAVSGQPPGDASAAGWLRSPRSAGPARGRSRSASERVAPRAKRLRPPRRAPSCDGGGAPSLEMTRSRTSTSSRATALTANPSDPQTPARAPVRPNIVWISNEDMSPRLGAYGDAIARTPTLDRLARNRSGTQRVHHGRCAHQPRRDHHGDVPDIHRRAAHAHDGGQGARAAGTVPRRPTVLRQGISEYLRAAGYYTTTGPRPTTNSASRSRSGNDLGRGAHWRQPRRPPQPFFSVFNIELTHEARFFRRARRGRARSS